MSFLSSSSAGVAPVVVVVAVVVVVEVVVVHPDHIQADAVDVAAPRHLALMAAG